MKSHLRTLLTALLLTASAAPVAAQNFSPGVRVNTDPPGTLQTSPFIAVDRSGAIYVAWTEAIEPDGNIIMVGRSTDRGVTFTKSRVQTQTPVLSGMQRGARIIVDGKGIVHLVWQPATLSADVLYTRSTDSGRTFAPPIDVTADSGRHNQDFPSIGADSIGNIYIAFVDDREERNKISAHTQIYMTRSTDGGLSFAPPGRISSMPKGRGGSCDCCNTDIALSPEGNVFVSFRSNIDNNRDIWIARSLDRGETFTTIRAASENWKLNACPMTGSSIVLDREGTAHVAWRDSRPSSEGRDFIFYTTLRAGDSLCAPDRRISATPRKSNYPSLAVTANGRVLCAFQDDRDDPADILLVGSGDGGETFDAPKQPGADKGMSRQELPQLATAPNGDRYLVWQDNSKDEGDIFFAADTTSSETGTSAVATEGIRSEPGLEPPAPNPADRYTIIRYFIPEGVRRDKALLTFHDMLGRPASAPIPADSRPGSHEARIDCSTIPAGSYRCVLTVDGRSISQSIIVNR